MMGKKSKKGIGLMNRMILHLMKKKGYTIQQTADRRCLTQLVYQNREVLTFGRRHLAVLLDRKFIQVADAYTNDQKYVVITYKLAE